MREYRFGAILPFLVTVSLACVNLRSIRYSRAMHITWYIANLVMLLSIGAVVAENQAVKDFLIEWYSCFYPELVPFMLEGGKPVATFATHSYAAYFFFYFFFLNLRRFQTTGSMFSLILSLLFLVSLWPLRCVASSVLLAVGILRALLALFSPRRVIVAMAAATFLLFAVLIVSESWSVIADTYDSLFTDPSAGFLARFGGGQLQPTLDYIVKNPLLGVGLGYSPALFFGDSGVVVMMLRGSLPLIVCFYLL